MPATRRRHSASSPRVPRARSASAAPSRSSASTRSSARPGTTSIAFLTNLAEHVGPEARFIHQGMTSSDVLDTALAVQLTARRRPVARGSRRRCSRAQATRLRAQIHADHRPQPRHPCRADDLRPQACRALCRIRPRPRPARGRAQARSRPARFRVRSAPSPISTRRSKPMSPKSSASNPNRSRPR